MFPIAEVTWSVVSLAGVVFAAICLCAWVMTHNNTKQ